MLPSMRGRVVHAVAVLITVTALQGASAQQATRLRVAVARAPRAVQPAGPVSFRPRPAAPDTIEHANPVVRGAEIGALVGAAAGFVYTLVLNTTKSCTEKNNVVCAEDVHDYRTLTYPIYGGVIGGVLGAMIGGYRR